MEQPITPNQEWTLRNWVATFGRRPDKLERTFLQADKGLSESQIDTWLRNEENASGTIFHAPLFSSLLMLTFLAVLGRYQSQQKQDKAKKFIEHGSDQPFDGLLSNGNNFYPNNINFDLPNDSRIRYLPSLQEEAPIWCPASPNNLSDQLQHNNLWSNMGCHDNGMPISEAPCLTETQYLLSDPYNPHWTYMSETETNRSSCISSRTWATVSSLSSFSDVYSEHQGNVDVSHLSKSSNCPHPLFSSSNAIQGDEGLHLTQIQKAKSKVLPPLPATSRQLKSKPTVPPKPEKLPSKGKSLAKQDKGPAKYICTVCTQPFARKGDWERHEDSQHDPQTHWICMLGSPAIQTLPSSPWIALLDEKRGCGQFELLER